MAEKSARRRTLEEGLAHAPDDPFLRYGLALQCLREGDVAEGRQRLRDLLASGAGEQEVATYQQLGQSYLETGEPDEARVYLAAGLEKARAAGDARAEAEMAGMLADLADSGPGATP